MNKRTVFFYIVFAILMCFCSNPVFSHSNIGLKVGDKIPDDFQIESPTLLVCMDMLHENYFLPYLKSIQEKTKNSYLFF